MLEAGRMYGLLFLLDKLVPGVTATFALKTHFYIEAKEFISWCDFWLGRKSVILLFFVVFEVEFDGVSRSGTLAPLLDQRLFGVGNAFAQVDEHI